MPVEALNKLPTRKYISLGVYFSHSMECILYYVTPLGGCGAPTASSDSSPQSGAHPQLEPFECRGAGESAWESVI